MPDTWKRECKDCKYSLQCTDEEGVKYYQCRFGSPTAIEYNEIFVGQWPEVGSEDWCWQWDQKQYVSS